MGPGLRTGVGGKRPVPELRAPTFMHETQSGNLLLAQRTMVPDTSKPCDQFDWTHELHMGRARWWVADHIYELVDNYDRFVPGLVPIPDTQHPDSAFSDELK
ncbi:hypothetical protein LPJ78_001614 [Coemansia sp. RSA 989]|nr:hypothetical protein LPJ68_001079 [Coemansia sp. RSA 1086]KAJ1866663.1 hypothetical protein LPJ78_001614 [Coemansia sp. RSA 989]KAJ1875514.1 hypothetical protein LPJ55_000679 [Coemansia sp. RSA 990]KAJ2674979.1 hypothetical protein IWW42_001481 [Coemansia sp. RSA 1085]